MKAIIFDVDNTLIDWKNEYVFVLRNLLKEIFSEITDEKINEIDSIIESDSMFTHLSKEGLKNAIENNCDIKLPNDFLDKLIIGQGMCFTEDKSLVDTIEYLSKKYDLYVISNWFTLTQEERLKNLGIKDYFKAIYGADKNYFKPDIRAFNVILEKYDAKECTYVGDSLNADIIPASSVGMNVIWRTKEQSNEYTTIKNISELKSIL